MSGILLIVVGILYLAVSLNYFSSGNVGMGIAFLCYSIANAGLYLAGVKS